MFTTTRLVVVGCLLSLAVSCSPAGRNNTGDDTMVDATGSGSGSGSGTDAPVVDDSRVYAHSGTILYRVDTTSHVAAQIGAIAPLTIDTAVNDIAIDKDHHMVGIGNNAVLTIDPDTGAVLSEKALDASAKGFSSLSYIPSGTAGAADVLVAANKDGVVYSIDPVAGSATMIGNYGMKSGKQIGSSGDIIGVVGAGIFATVDVGTTGATTNDYLATIDPTNGYKATLLPNDTGFNRIFGLAYWAGKIYGFVDVKDSMSGQLIQIDPATGVGTKLEDNLVEWYGAGVETTAPIIGRQTP